MLHFPSALIKFLTRICMPAQKIKLSAAVRCLFLRLTRSQHQNLEHWQQPFQNEWRGSDIDCFFRAF